MFILHTPIYVTNRQHRHTKLIFLFGFSPDRTKLMRNSALVSRKLIFFPFDQQIKWGKKAFQILSSLLTPQTRGTAVFLHLFRTSKHNRNQINYEENKEQYLIIFSAAKCKQQKLSANSPDICKVTKLLAKLPTQFHTQIVINMNYKHLTIV